MADRDLASFGQARAHDTNMKRNDDSVPGRSLAVFVRAHASDEKTLDLLQALSHNEHYDLYLCVNESNGPIHFSSDIHKISITTADFRAKGIPCEAQYSMLYFSDVLFSLLKERVPRYSYYALIEYDVHFEVDAADFMACLSRRLGEEDKPIIDLVGTHVCDQSEAWLWYSSAYKRYPKVISAFFPLVILSERAIDQVAKARDEELQSRIRLGRMGEPSPSGSDDDWVFCEAFVASELHRSGFTVADLNWLVENSYRSSSFNVGPAHLFEEGARYDEEVKIVHPVCPVKDTLFKRLYLASTNGTVRDFLSFLDSRDWPLPADEIQQLRNKALTYIESANS